VRYWVADPNLDVSGGAPAAGSVPPHAGACEKRVVRGGGWMDGGATARSAYRYADEESFRSYQVGFRVARDL
jgi:formylglycine-generating enzyme required for sulfatase activity